LARWLRGRMNLRHVPLSALGIEQPSPSSFRCVRVVPAVAPGESRQVRERDQLRLLWHTQFLNSIIHHGGNLSLGDQRAGRSKERIARDSLAFDTGHTLARQEVTFGVKSPRTSEGHRLSGERR